MTKGAALLISSLALCLAIIALMDKPAGATLDINIINGTGAVCQDGAISLSTESGACSHHGGVMEWIDGR